MLTKCNSDTNGSAVEAKASEVNVCKLVHITTVPLSLGFLRGQVPFMVKHGIEVHAISSPGPALLEFAAANNINCSSVEMTRDINPLKDLVALFKLVRVLRRIKPQIVHAHTPKGGRIGMLASFLAGVPIRVFHLRGLRFTTTSGLKRAVLRFCDKLTCMLAHRVFSISASMRDDVVREHLCSAEKITVLCKGSGNGVDAEVRFNPARFDENTRVNVRSEHDIPADALVIGFVGRLVRDKGVTELILAWERLRSRYENLYLLVLGGFEREDPLPDHIVEILQSDARIRLVDWTPNPESFYLAMDLLALPTYREGFGNVLLEANSMGVPVVSSRISGCVDAIQDSVTGLLVPPHDVDALEAAIEQYLLDSDLRRAHAGAGRERACRDFKPEAIWQALFNEYMLLLRGKGLMTADRSDTEVG